MSNIIGVRFKKPGKIYFFDPGQFEVKIKDKVIVETAMGQELGEVVINNKDIPEEKIKSNLKPIIRAANEKDIKHYEENREKEKEAFKCCEAKIKEHKLDMNLIDISYTFDNAKLIFYFTADGRVDFRELVKDLASIFRTRIELRQIGVRDQVRRIGGNGVCGRELCCCTFLNNFDAVSIKNAKEQNISLNPAKISGNCGRLMCCLRYEQDVYEEKLKRLPKVGAIVKTSDGEGIVDNVETLKEIVRVKIKNGEDISYKKYSVSEIKIIKNIEEKEMEPEDPEEKANLKELEKLEKLDKIETANKDEDY